LDAQTYLVNTHQGHGKKNQVGNWGRKTKPTQGASVNTPRHCGEIDVSLFSHAIGSQANEMFIKLSQLWNASAS
jgi:hypothetical protein